MSYNVWSQLGALARTSFAGSVRNIYFAAMVVAGMAFLAWISTGIDVMPDATIYPETRRVTSYLGADFFLIQIIVIVYYSGELIWRERDCRVQQIHDALPVQAWITYAAKLVALAGVVILLQLVVLAVGITVQTLAGYHHYELWLYARELFGVQLIDLLLIAGLALFVQVLVDQRYIGYALLVLPWLLPGVQRFGIEHNLLVPGGDPGIDYSDLNGYGPFATPFVWFKSYWGALIVLLSFIAVLFQAHGEERLWRSRITLARRRLTRGSLAGMAVAIAGMIFCAGFIFYNTNVINTFRSSDVINADRATYERRYSQTGRLVPPAIRDMNVEVELYPGRGAARGRGTYTLVNESSRAIDSIVVTLPTKETETTSLEFDRPVETLQSDPVLGHTLHRLAEPLQPGDTLVLSFAVKHEHAGFTNTTDRLDVVRNGTFVSHDRLFPRIGYDRSRELVNPQVRAGFGLPPRRDPASDDAQARLRNEIGLGSWSTFEAVVSTRADQIALAPGSLVEKWEDGRRRYFRYSSRGQRMLPSPAYMSARYGVARDRWGDVDLEVYYHPGHEYDIGRFMEAMKQALSYNTAAVGPYPFGTARIVEAPHYEIAAQALPGMIPYSEDVGFIARIDGRKTGAVDYPFVNTAHEMAHQWWANQVIGADVPGSKVLTETLASYSALRVYERALGPERTRQYLAGQRDRYLAGRRRDRRGELPLLSVESRHGYVYYNKGTLVFHALADLIGEDRLDGALREFFTANRFRPAPFPTTAQLYERLRAATPDSLRYFLADAFEHITLYDLRVTGATVTSLDGGANRVDIDIDARKMHADEDGNTVDAPMEDWIDVGVFGAGPRRDPLHLRKHRLRSGVQHISVVVEGEPRRVVIDPDLMLIERNLRDNSAITQSPGTATTNGSTTAIGGQFHLMLSEAETHATRQPTRHQDLLYRQPR